MELLTPRLRLREFRLTDLDALHDLYGCPVFQKYEDEPYSLARTRLTLGNFIEWQMDVDRKRIKLAVTLPPDDTARGMVSLKLNWAEIHEWEIGWGMHPAEWGKGYATEAARAMLKVAFEERAAHRVVAYCHAGNAASWRVMEKLGMTREGRLRGVRWLQDCWNDEYIYSMLDDEYKKA